MRLGLKALFLAILLGSLAFAAVACPLWMTASSEDHTHCSQDSNPPTKCPITICQANSPYLTASATIEIPVLLEIPAETVDPVIKLRGAGETITQYDGAPPGRDVPVFLRTRSLPI